MLPADTAPEARRQQLAAYRALGGEGRLEVAFALSEDVRRIALDGIRSRDPTLADRHIQREWLRLLHGERVAEAFTGAGHEP